MRKFMIALAVLGLSATSTLAAAAENWVVFYQGSDGTTWVDLASIVSEGSVRTFNEKIAVQKPRHASVRATLQIDCAANTEASVSLKAYDDESGRLIMDDGPQKPEPFDNPDQMKLRNLVCGSN